MAQERVSDNQSPLVSFSCIDIFITCACGSGGVRDGQDANKMVTEVQQTNHEPDSW